MKIFNLILNAFRLKKEKSETLEPYSSLKAKLYDNEIYIRELKTHIKKLNDLIKAQTQDIEFLNICQEQNEKRLKSLRLIQRIANIRPSASATHFLLEAALTNPNCIIITNSRNYAEHLKRQFYILRVHSDIKTSTEGFPRFLSLSQFENHNPLAGVPHDIPIVFDIPSLSI